MQKTNNNGAKQYCWQKKETEMKTVNFSNILGNDVENVNDIELNTKKRKEKC